MNDLSYAETRTERIALPEGHHVHWLFDVYGSMAVDGEMTDVSAVEVVTTSRDKVEAELLALEMQPLSEKGPRNGSQGIRLRSAMEHVRGQCGHRE